MMGSANSTLTRGTTLVISTGAGASSVAPGAPSTWRTGWPGSGDSQPVGGPDISPSPGAGNTPARRGPVGVRVGAPGANGFGALALPGAANAPG